MRLHHQQLRIATDTQLRRRKLCHAGVHLYNRVSTHDQLFFHDQTCILTAVAIRVTDGERTWGREA